MQGHLHHPWPADGVGNEPDVLGGWRRIDIARIGIETRIESDVVVGSVKAGVVEQIEHVQLILQLETLIDLKQLVE